MQDAVLGIIGGSGLYAMDALQEVSRVRLRTPLGDPSDEFVKGTVNGVTVVFLPRHGRGHRLAPSKINYRANVFGMKMLGVTHLVSVSAVGSMHEDIRPGHMVVCDQFFDRTQGRINTFYGEGIVAHVHFADPVCPDLSKALYEACREEGVTVHNGGTYLVIEGPQFSTRAESRIYRQWGVDVIGMTNLPEARLAREAEMCYATLALATDYDCWHESEEDVSTEAVLEIIRQNVSASQGVIARVAAKISGQRNCICSNAMENAIITDREVIPDHVKRDLFLLIGKYLTQI